MHPEGLITIPPEHVDHGAISVDMNMLPVLRIGDLPPSATRKFTAVHPGEPDGDRAQSAECRNIVIRLSDVDYVHADDTRMEIGEYIRKQPESWHGNGIIVATDVMYGSEHTRAPVILDRNELDSEGYVVIQALPGHEASFYTKGNSPVFEYTFPPEDAPSDNEPLLLHLMNTRNLQKAKEGIDASLSRDANSGVTRVFTYPTRHLGTS